MPGVVGARTVNVNVPIIPGRTRFSAVAARRFRLNQETALPSSANFVESLLTPRVTCLSVPRCHGARPGFRTRTVYDGVAPGARVGGGPLCAGSRPEANAI